MEQQAHQPILVSALSEQRKAALTQILGLVNEWLVALSESDPPKHDFNIMIVGAPPRQCIEILVQGTTTQLFLAPDVPDLSWIANGGDTLIELTILDTVSVHRFRFAPSPERLLSDVFTGKLSSITQSTFEYMYRLTADVVTWLESQKLIRFRSLGHGCRVVDAADIVAMDAKITAMRIAEAKGGEGR
jgi:hypothetical protein